MTDPHPHRSPATRLALRQLLGLGLAAGIALAACDTTITPSESAGVPISATSAAPSSDVSSPPTSPQTGQTDTDWGRIWDALPADFPVYPGATPAEEAETGPVSATFALEGTDPEAIVAWMQAQLEFASYTTQALNGPLEDGSFVLESIGPTSGCRVEVAVAPLGGLMTMTVRYGAACPNA
ncbi:MAG: hypothetical protein Q7S35_11625 [Candidatus Limnocylindrales bacterium]|nr:hypothetical protein [Candidatus Limnocylindrales bacterium]